MEINGARVWAFEWETSYGDYKILEAIIPDQADPSLAGYADWYRKCAVFGVAGGEKISLYHVRNQDVAAIAGNSTHSFPGCNNQAWILTEEQRVAILALEANRAAATAAKESAAAQQATETESAIRDAALATNSDQELERWMADCDGSTRGECSFDSLRKMVRPDGSTYIARTHCH